MDPFSRLHDILAAPCPKCGTPLRSGACPTCGVAEEADETLNVVLDEGTRRIAVAPANNNLSRLLSALVALERQEIRTDAALAGIDPVLDQFRTWRDEVGAVDLASLSDAEQEMFAFHAPLSTHMVVVLEAYRRAVQEGDLEAARELAGGLSDGFAALEELLRRFP
jgi:hypothetical protein